MATYYLIVKLVDGGDDLPALCRAIRDADLESSDEPQTMVVPDELVRDAKRIHEAV